MSSIAIGMDVHKANNDFNRLWQGTMTRIRRSFMVKSAAIERMSSSDEETRASGIYHFNLMIDSQFRVYSAYIEIYAKIKIPREASLQMEALESKSFGLVKGFLFSQHKRKLQTALADLQERYAQLHSLMVRLFDVVSKQRELLTVGQYLPPKQLELFKQYEHPEQGELFLNKEKARKMRKLRSSDITSENFRKLLALIEQEESISNEFIAELKAFNDSFEALMSSYKAMQKKVIALIEFMKENFRNMDLASVSAAVGFMMRWIWAVYGLKIATVWCGTAFGPMAPTPEMQLFIHSSVHNIMLADNFLDTSMVVSVAYNSGAINDVLKLGKLKCQEAHKKGSSMFAQFVAQVSSLRKGLPEAVSDTI